MSAIEQPAAKVRQDRYLLRLGEDIGNLGHEVHAAKHQVLRICCRRQGAKASTNHR